MKFSIVEDTKAHEEEIATGSSKDVTENATANIGEIEELTNEDASYDINDEKEDSGRIILAEADIGEKTKAVTIMSVDSSDTSESGKGEDMIFPVVGSGVITRQYSEEHKGVDISAEEGTTVVSVCDGKVEEVGANGKEGKYIVIKNNEAGTVKYSHLQNNSYVDEGTEVSTGSKVGTVGSTGESTGPHVHIEVTDNQGNLVDPISVIEDK